MDTSKRARTIVVQSRVDPRSLATIARYFYGEYRVWLPTTSGLVHAIVEEMRSIIVGINPEMEVEDTIDAMKVLSDLGQSPTPTGRRFLEQMQREQGLNPEMMIPSKTEREQRRRQEARDQDRLTSIRTEAERLIASGSIDRMMLEKETEGQTVEDAYGRAKGAGIIEDEPTGEGVENEEEAQARRDKELEEMKSELSKRPNEKE